MRGTDFRDIPGWFNWPDIYEEVVRDAVSGQAHVVETGTFFGRSAAFLGMLIVESGKDIKFDTWDIWVGGQGAVPQGELDMVSPFVMVQLAPAWLTLKLTEETTRKHLEGWPVNVCSGDALKAAQLYEDNSLDLVYLDDDHSLQHVYEECMAWWPKVKKGGRLAGHDWNWPSVQDGVNNWLWSTPERLVVESRPPQSWQVRRG